AYTVRFIAELWGISEQFACERLMENTERVYGNW
ncbi:MAG: TatD family deoxyribonuclease, partial [Actinomyces sp.]|nr:TatD family deoxyribonuclease [Actinomyces sp.]